MRRLVLVLFSLAAALELGAITATKEYVDKQDAALRANLSGARSVQDLNVYGVKVSHDLDDAALPITWQYGGATYTNAIIDAIVDTGEGVFLSFSAEASGDFGGEAVKVYFDEVGVASSIQMYSSATYFFGDKPYKTGEWPRLKTSLQPTGDQLATTSTVALNLA